MSEVVESASIFIPQAAFTKGCALLIMAVIWFCMANFNKKGEPSLSTIFYMIIGMVLFIASSFYFISVFFRVGITTRITIIVMLILAVLIITFIIAYTIIRKENSQMKGREILNKDETEIEKEGGELDGFK